MSTNNQLNTGNTPLPYSQGGTGAALTADNGGILYSTATVTAILASTATALQLLQSGASGAPTWSTATYPATATGTGTLLRADGTNWAATTLTIPNTAAVSTILYASATNVISALATANNGVLVTGAGGIPAISSTIPSATQDNITRLGTISSGVWNGTALIGTYGGTGVNNGASTITVGGNTAFSGAHTFTATITSDTAVTFPTSGTLATTAQLNGDAWVNITGTTQTAAIGTMYVVGNASQTTVTLPATAALGSVIGVQGKGAGGWILTANTGQTIKLGAVTTSSAGSLTSINLYDSVEVVCITADTTWSVTRVFSTGLTYS